MISRYLTAIIFFVTYTSAQPTLYRADVKADRTATRFESILTLRYPSELDISPKPEIFIGSPIGGFRRVSPDAIAVSLFGVVVRLTADETETIDNQAAAGQKLFLYIRNLMAGGKATDEQFVGIWSGKPKLTFEAIRSNTLTVQENYLPPEIEKFKSAPGLWQLRDSFGKEYRITKVNAPSAPGERHITFDLDVIPRSVTSLDLGIRPAPVAQAPASVAVSGIKTAAAPQATKDDPTGGADIYAAFLLTSTGGGDPVYGADVRAKKRVYVNVLGGGYFGISPSFAIKANSKTTDDENSATIAAQFEWLYPLNKPTVVRSIYLFAAPKVEAEKNFDNKNGVAELTGMLIAPAFGQKKFGLRPRVSLGTELGKNIANVLPRLDGKSIVRWKATADLNSGYEVNQAWLKDIRLDLSFTHRQLFEPELFTAVAKTTLPGGVLIAPGGGMIAVSPGTLSRTVVSGVSKGTRNYFETKLRFGITPNIELFTSYNRGSLPPIYEKVDKVQVGIAYRLSVPFF